MAIQAGAKTTVTGFMQKKWEFSKTCGQKMAALSIGVCRKIPAICWMLELEAFHGPVTLSLCITEALLFGKSRLACGSRAENIGYFYFFCPFC